MQEAEPWLTSGGLTVAGGPAGLEQREGGAPWEQGWLAAEGSDGGQRRSLSAALKQGGHAVGEGG